MSKSFAASPISIALLWEVWRAEEFILFPVYDFPVLSDLFGDEGPDNITVLFFTPDVENLEILEVFFIEFNIGIVGLNHVASDCDRLRYVAIYNIIVINWQ